MKLYKIVATLALPMLMGACNDDSMDRFPVEKQSEETAFNTSSNFRTYAWSLYNIFTIGSGQITRSYGATGANQSY